MAMIPFLHSGFWSVTNPFKKRLDSNFDQIWNILLQKLHGATYQVTTESATTITTQDVFVKAAGTITQSGDGYGYTIGTGLEIQHTHTEPSGTTHYYDIVCIIHLALANGDIPTVRIRRYIDDTSTWETLWEATEDAIQSGGGQWHIKAIGTARAQVANLDLIRIDLAQTIGTNNITVLEGSTMQLKGV